VDGDLKAIQQNKLHLQKNRMRKDLEAKHNSSGIYFEYENERTNKLKKN
jgi:hypothetical protein